MATDDEISLTDTALGQLTRRVQDIYLRFENIATKIETMYITKEYFKLAVELLEQKMLNIESSYKEEIKSAKESHETDLADLKLRVGELEDDKKWLVRLVLATVILAILGTVFVATRAGPQ